MIRLQHVPPYFALRPLPAATALECSRSSQSHHGALYRSSLVLALLIDATCPPSHPLAPHTHKHPTLASVLLDTSLRLYVSASLHLTHPAHDFASKMPGGQVVFPCLSEPSTFTMAFSGGDTLVIVPFLLSCKPLLSVRAVDSAANW